MQKKLKRIQKETEKKCKHTPLNVKEKQRRNTYTTFILQKHKENK